MGDEGLGGMAQDTDQSPLLQALLGSIGGGGMDPYGLPPGGPDNVLDGGGTGDPNMGMQQLMMLLALAKMGIGGAPPPGPSGVEMAPDASGLAAGLM